MSQDKKEGINPVMLGTEFHAKKFGLFYEMPDNVTNNTSSAKYAPKSRYFPHTTYEVFFTTALDSPTFRNKPQNLWVFTLD